ncbi:Hypothetical protein I595_1015 [Croceitalea dokdonensis DOKDO 023]|uniref:Uncharacterized protein n=1 Tax=Croceitalea dokdonensis DOKDO 023 TaxID=1300341 RepID=A0A0P7AWU7_9FLAO|nr:Hypothetical protein I595_1015 [Croceitalea dokdonensis DOKDO 023]
MGVYGQKISFLPEIASNFMLWTGLSYLKNPSGYLKSFL